MHVYEGLFVRDALRLSRPVHMNISLVMLTTTIRYR